MNVSQIYDTDNEPVEMKIDVKTLQLPGGLLR